MRALAPSFDSFAGLDRENCYVERILIGPERSSRFPPLIRESNPLLKTYCEVHPNNFGEWGSEAEMEQEKLDGFSERLRERSILLSWISSGPLSGLSGG